MKTAILILLLITTIALPAVSACSMVFWPSFLALSLAILTRLPALSLATGAFVGVIYLNLHQPQQILSEFIGTHFLEKVASPWNTSILFFTLIFGGFAGILQYGGGLTALAQRMLKPVGDKTRSMEQSAMILGLICFFDGLINSMLVGRLFRPLAARYLVSKARLAYIVDSTSSPIACLSIASTWIAYQLSMIQEGISTAEVTLSPYLLYLSSWPANFYCIFSLVLLFSSIRFQWLIGPMKSYPTHEPEQVQSIAEKSTANGLIAAAISSLIVLLVTLVGGLLLDGLMRSPDGTPLFEIIAQAQASTVLLLVSVLTSAFAFGIHYRALRQPDQKSSEGLTQAFWQGAAQMMQPLTVLLAAWILSSTLKELGTAAALAAMLDTTLSPAHLPIAIFITGSLISFFTGTSWGTMGILTPLLLPVAISLSPDVAADPSLLSFTIGAIFSGAVFGDHCSPLSDTTIVTAVACGIDPMDHVRTQLPYALLAAGWACLLGFLPVGYGSSPWIPLIPSAILLFFLPAVSKRIFRNQTQ